MDWPLLSPLSPHERHELMGSARSRTFLRNEVIVREGDPADSLHLVESGHMAVRGSLASGATATLNILGPGDYFGELALLRPDGRRTATVVAIDESRTLVVAASVFNRLCRTNPGLERALSMLLAESVDRLSRRLLETMFVGLDRRVYRRLVDLAGSFGTVDNAASIPLSQSSLADLVGATRPSVNQDIQRLVDQGVVGVRRGRIDVLDVEALIRRSGA